MDARILEITIALILYSDFQVAARNGVVVGCAEPPADSSVTAVTAMRSPAGTGSEASARPDESVLNVPRLTGGRPVSIPHSW
jgi:hypothetical protein